MKKAVYSVSIIIIACLVFLNACGQTGNVKSVDLEGYGSILVPENWTASTVDGFTYFKAADGSCTLVQYRSGEAVNAYFSDIKNMIWLQDENFSNGACVTKYKVEYQNGNFVELFAICFSGSDNYESTEFLCLNTSLTEAALQEIAKSYNVSE